ncbi:MAG: hypothetical protein ACE5PV_18100 [Candidatus Poribacteria bacterium]
MKSGINKIALQKVDKFAEVGLTPISDSKVKPLLIAECPVNLEWKPLQIEYRVMRF